VTARAIGCVRRRKIGRQSLVRAAPLLLLLAGVERVGVKGFSAGSGLRNRPLTRTLREDPPNSEPLPASVG